MLKRIVSLMLIAALPSCASLDHADASRGATELPSMRWDQMPEAETWTKATLAAIDSHGVALTQTVPADISEYCPAYGGATSEDRKAFWAGLLSALAKFESSWRETAVGGGGQWFGLVQIAPGTARAFGCDAKSGEALKDGVSNLSCAVRIMASTIERDGVVSEGRRGVATQWTPFKSSEQRADMIEWSRAQPYCQGRG